MAIGNTGSPSGQVENLYKAAQFLQDLKNKGKDINILMPQFEQMYQQAATTAPSGTIPDINSLLSSTPAATPVQAPMAEPISPEVSSQAIAPSASIPLKTSEAPLSIQMPSASSEQQTNIAGWTPPANTTEIAPITPSSSSALSASIDYPSPANLASKNEPLYASPQPSLAPQTQQISEGPTSMQNTFGMPLGNAPVEAQTQQIPQTPTADTIIKTDPLSYVSEFESLTQGDDQGTNIINKISKDPNFLMNFTTVPRSAMVQSPNLQKFVNEYESKFQLQPPTEDSPDKGIFEDDGAIFKDPISGVPTSKSSFWRRVNALSKGAAGVFTQDDIKNVIKNENLKDPVSLNYILSDPNEVASLAKSLGNGGQIQGTTVEPEYEALNPGETSEAVMEESPNMNTLNQFYPGQSIPSEVGSPSTLSAVDQLYGGQPSQMSQPSIGYLTPSQGFSQGTGGQTQQDYNDFRGIYNNPYATAADQTVMNYLSSTGYPSTTPPPDFAQQPQVNPSLLGRIREKVSSLNPFNS